MAYAKNLFSTKIGLMNDFSLCACLSRQIPDNFADAGNSSLPTFEKK